MDNDFKTQYPYYYHEDAYCKFIKKNKELYGVDNILKFNVERFRLKNVDLDKLIPVCYAGLFAVSKDVIRENTADYYNNIMSILIYDVRMGLYNKKLDHGQFLEKLWLVIFNYKKNNKNYIDLNIKDYLTYDTGLKVKNNNNINFKLFNIYCQLYIEIKLDNVSYDMFISRYKITFKQSNKILVKNAVRLNNNIQEALKDMTNLEINILLHNNILQVTGNNTLLINYKFNKSIHKITYGKIYALSIDNKFKNWLF